ncbi:MAG: VCBS repeat-containing protein [Phycisphaerae bacterium]|nr:VCBS repeat-containing protein [Phycisphaerae bacterium]
MRRTNRPIRWTAMIGAALIATTATAGPEPLVVTGTSPAARGLTASVATPISVTFDRAVTPASIDATRFHAMGRWSGPVTGAITVSGDGRTVTLTPDASFSAGEMIWVILAGTITATDGGTLDGGYAFQFWTASATASMDFEEIQRLTTRTTPGESSRAYGGIGTDLNGDGYLDITIVNEDTADLRVFMNRADGSGLFDPFIEPTFPVGDRASPSEPADFNLDGHADICVANIDDDTVSILLGNGDGTFAPQQKVAVGVAPRGIAVLDVDADGDVDIVNTNATSGNLSLLLNDGTGVFGAPTFFDGGGNGEWALASADMNEDGRLDLVVGARFSQEVNVLAGDAAGGFSLVSERGGVGSIWMLNCGDLDGDGHDDVATANSSSNSGSILLGDGAGGLAPPITQSTDFFPLATDVGDLDGDGDLDWVTSSFSGDWWIFRNDGTGVFEFDQEVLAPSAASCALPADVDNDGDLDLVLIDEIADVLIVMENVGAPCVADVDGSGDVGFADLLIVIASWGPCPAGCPGDLDGSKEVDFIDLLTVLAAWGPCPR